MTSEISRDEVRSAIEDKLCAHFGITSADATDDQVFQASAMESCLSLGFDMSLARSVPGGRTSSYLYITDSAGDMPSERRRSFFFILLMFIPS